MTMKRHQMGRSSTWANLACIGCLALSLPAFASLGGDVTSVQPDSAHLKASIKVTPSSAYAVHEMKSPMGTTVREFVSPDGRVFAVAWRGPAMPPMQQILGTYFQQYSAAVQAHHAAQVGRRPLNVQQPGLVVQSGGRPRGFFGRAYIPGILPQGITPDQIR